MGFRICGQNDSFCIVADSKYYKDKISCSLEHRLRAYGGMMVGHHKKIVKMKFTMDSEGRLLDNLVCLLQQFKIKYTLAIGTVIVYKYEDTFVLTGYVKPNVVEAFDVYHPTMHYSTTNEECYVFSIEKYENVIRILKKCGVAFLSN